MPGVVRVRLNETVPIKIYAAAKKGRVISSFAEDTIKQFRKELAEAKVHWQKWAFDVNTLPKQLRLYGSHSRKARLRFRPNVQGC